MNYSLREIIGLFVTKLGLFVKKKLIERHFCFSNDFKFSNISIFFISIINIKYTLTFDILYIYIYVIYVNFELNSIVVW